MKKIHLFAVTALALASCTSDEFVGNRPGQGNTPLTTEAINFGGSQKATTRATNLEDYVSSFTVFGNKETTNDAGVVNTYQVYQNYTVVNNETNKGRQEDNAAGWEYVGQKSQQDVDQTIKYWDYTTDQYLFHAFAPANRANTNFVTATVDVEDGNGSGSTSVIVKKDEVYKLTAKDVTPTDMFFFTLPTKVLKSAYQNVVNLEFRRITTRVRLALYETVPGYSVTDVKFYTTSNATETSSLEAGINGTFDKKADYTITFNNAQQTVTTETTNVQSDNMYNFGELQYTNKSFTQKTYSGTSLVASTPVTFGTLATNSAAPTYALGGGAGNGYYVDFLSNQAGNPISLKVDYTLRSDDNSGEVINVYGATAYVPSVYTQWQPNYAYTYVFKISDNTNGTTKPGAVANDNPAGLYPITFDAIVSDYTDNAEGYTTTVSAPSITTYQAGSVYGNNVIYTKDKAIQVSVYDGTTNFVLATSGNPLGIDYAYYGTKAITEAEVESKTSASPLTYSDLAAYSSVNPVTGASTAQPTIKTFTPDKNGYYVVRYRATEAVADVAATYEAVTTNLTGQTEGTSGEYLKAGQTYYTGADGTGSFVAGTYMPVNEGTTYYYEKTPLVKGHGIVYAYKVVYVGDAPAANAAQGGQSVTKVKVSNTMVTLTLNADKTNVDNVTPIVVTGTDNAGSTLTLTKGATIGSVGATTYYVDGTDMTGKYNVYLPTTPGDYVIKANETETKIEVYDYEMTISPAVVKEGETVTVTVKKEDALTAGLTLTTTGGTITDATGGAYTVNTNGLAAGTYTVSLPTAKSVTFEVKANTYEVKALSNTVNNGTAPVIYVYKNGVLSNDATLTCTAGTATIPTASPAGTYTLANNLATGSYTFKATSNTKADDTATLSIEIVDWYSITVSAGSKANGSDNLASQFTATAKMNNAANGSATASDITVKTASGAAVAATVTATVTAGEFTVVLPQTKGNYYICYKDQKALVEVK